MTVLPACRACLPVDRDLSTPGQPAAICARTLTTPPAEPCGAVDFEDLRRASPFPALDPVGAGRMARELDEALAKLPRLSLNERVAEAERVHATRQAAQRQAEELLEAASQRAHRDVLTHLRIALVVGALIAANGLPDEETETARDAAAIALELVERDRPTAEARLEFVRQLARAYLERGGPISARQVAEELLEALGADGGEDDYPAADVARGLVAGCLAGALPGYATPVDLAHSLVAHLERAGLAIVRRPAP